VDNFSSEIWEGLLTRTTGPLKFRFFLQPSVAIFLAIRGGLADWRQGKPPFFWDLLAQPAKRKELLRDGWKSISKLFILACVLDSVYQVIVLHWLYPLDALILACLLAIIPYLLVRGPANRIISAYKLPAYPSVGKKPQDVSPVRKAGVL